MKIRVLAIVGRHPALSLALTSVVLGSCIITHKSVKVDDQMPVSLIGVQHLGSDYLINRFYINRDIGGNVGEGGGGGGMVCCLTLPKRWNPALKADVRWKVHHVVRSSDPAIPETEEVAGIYHAEVPIERYAEPGDFYVHFFRGGRVRIVVSEISPSGERHPIQWGDTEASQTATIGTAIKELFTVEEVVESERETARDRAKYGDWR